MAALMALLGDPQHDVPVIHITGTNGKGTVAAMITRLLRAHGLSVGTYTSPHLEVLNERLSRDGVPISDVDLAEVLSGIALIEPLLESRPSWFEVVTAAAFRWFAEAPVDVAVVEVGLLGRYDATNVAEARVAVVTSIGGDHTDFAPGWELAIASEKAGIIGPEATAVIGDVTDDVLGAFVAEGPAELLRYGDGDRGDFSVLDDRIAVGGHVVDLRGPDSVHRDVFLAVHGHHQVVNASIALAAVEAFFRRPVDDEVLQEAFADLDLPGRFEVIGREPLVVLDGAHNADALRALARTLDDEFTPAGSRLVVFGALQGRDLDATVVAVAALRPDLVICTTIAGERGLDARRLASACDAAGLPNEWAADPEAAVARALSIAQEEDVVMVTGSFRLLGPARRVVATSR